MTTEGDEDAIRDEEIWNSLDLESRLAAAAFVIRKIVDHGREGGTFRYLIYDRLGFGPEAYVPLYLAGGMHISNHFEIDRIEGEKDD
jgi:hypothetical protein